MKVPRHRPVLNIHWRLIVLVAVSISLGSWPAAADPWYAHYANAENALQASDWKRAVEEINEALARKGDSGARVRSYGMNVVAYFPYLKLGIAYYHLGQFDAALQAFETEARLGAIARSAPDSAELERFRVLTEDARSQAAAEKVSRVRQIVERSLEDARDLEKQGLLDEAVAALDIALAVAPEHPEALAAMSGIRQKLANEESRRLSDEAQERLRAELERLQADGKESLGSDSSLDDIRDLESSGQLVEALQRVQAVLAADPSNREALSIRERLVQARRRDEVEQARRESIGRLLIMAGSELDKGAAEASLAAANRVLALDPANEDARAYIARAYESIGRRLLGSGSGGNIPPAIRFVDLRTEDEGSGLAQRIGTPDFLLNGVVIDNSPVDVAFFDGDNHELEGILNVQPLGDYYLTGFRLETRLPPGASSVRLVATDLEGLASSSEYSVIYTPPIYRSAWFQALLLGIVTAGVSALIMRRRRRAARLRKRRYNPYVAGAPVLDEDMFFGRSELVDRILQTIHNNSLLIYGERRIGKTSIQHHLKKRLLALDDPAYKFHPVYVDLQGTPETRFFRTIAEDIFLELGPDLNGLEMTGGESGEYVYRDLVRDIRAALKVLGQKTPKKVKLVLLIDEVDELNDYDPRVNQKLRSLFMKSFAENLAAVVSGVEIKKRWEKEGSPWYNFFEEIEVKPLDTADARDLVERPIRGMFRLDRGATDRIVALTEGKPYLLQKFCIALVTRLHEQGRRRITVADVENVADIGAAQCDK